MWHNRYVTYQPREGYYLYRWPLLVFLVILGFSFSACSASNEGSSQQAESETSSPEIPMTSIPDQVEVEVVYEKEPLLWFSTTLISQLDTPRT